MLLKYSNFYFISAGIIITSFILSPRGRLFLFFALSSSPHFASSLALKYIKFKSFNSTEALEKNTHRKTAKGRCTEGNFGGILGGGWSGVIGLKKFVFDILDSQKPSKDLNWLKKCSKIKKFWINFWICNGIMNKTLKIFEKNSKISRLSKYFWTFLNENSNVSSKVLTFWLKVQNNFKMFSKKFKICQNSSLLPNSPLKTPSKPVKFPVNFSHRADSSVFLNSQKRRAGKHTRGNSSLARFFSSRSTSPCLFFIPLLMIIDDKILSDPRMLVRFSLLIHLPNDKLHGLDISLVVFVFLSALGFVSVKMGFEFAFEPPRVSATRWWKPWAAPRPFNKSRAEQDWNISLMSHDGVGRK